MSRPMDEEEPSLLLIILDASSAFWTKREAVRRRQKERPGSGEVKLSSFQDTVEATLMFVESYLMMHRRNEVCFVACTARESTIIFPTPAMEGEQRSLGRGSVSTKEFQNCLWDGLGRVVERGHAADAAGGGDEGCALAGSLSKGLCYVNRKMRESSSIQASPARTLVLSGSPDVPETYNSVMNAIFSAQKAGVLVDCAVLGESSTFLQQAAYLTGGLYLEHQGVGLAQYMFATFLPSQSCRKYLKLRTQQSVDFRAACFCHKRVVDIAYVCSVCLSVFCEFSPVCTTCGTRAWPKKIKRGKHKALAGTTVANGCS
ncbi:unnamed protein product [Ectocarpus sp. 12 AP-2014]